jgi:hypothetical protein
MIDPTVEWVLQHSLKNKPVTGEGFNAFSFVTWDGKVNPPDLLVGL